MVGSLLEDDIRNGESIHLEFKEGLPKDYDRYVKAAVSFSNCQGGKIVFGVSDDRRIVGVEGDPFKFRDEVIDIISSRCTPQLFPNSYITTIEGKNLVVVEVPPGSKRPYYITSRGINEGTFVRIGASSRIAGQDILKDLMLEGSNRSFDALDFIDERGIGLSQESIEHLCNFIKIKSA